MDDSEMVERVKAAIILAVRYEDFTGYDEEAGRRLLSAGAGEAIARAAICALREPSTETLKKAAVERDVALEFVTRANLANMENIRRANVEIRCRATNAEERLKEITELAREWNLAVINPYECLMQIAALCREGSE